MRVLIVDDDPKLRKSLQLLLGEAGYEVVAEGDAERALDRARNEEPDLVLCDVSLRAMDGVAFLQRYQETLGQGLIIMLSQEEQADAALAAVREGAYGYIPKPVRPEEVALTLRFAEERQRLRGEVESLRASLGNHDTPSELVAESVAMRNALDLAKSIAPGEAAVLVTGESGTGKKALARAIHARSPRRHERLMSVNCAVIPDHLVKGLLGHSISTSGDHPTGLFAQAAAGTLVLEEVGGLSIDIQTTVLEVIHSESGPHVIATSSQALESDARQGKFHPPLLERLQRVHITIPSLRERPEDIPGLLAHFAQRAAQRLGRPIGITPQALSLLTGYSWPGNVRELRMEVERAAALNPTGRLDREDFALTGSVDAARDGSRAAAGAGSAHTLKLKPQLESLERAAIRRALTASSGNRREAAQLLGVSLRTLFYKLSRYGLE